MKVNQLLDELRSNPDKNVKETFENKLRRYNNLYNNNLYIHFTDVNKLGLNPHYSSPFSPNGLYCYSYDKLRKRSYASYLKYCYFMEVDTSDFLIFSKYDFNKFEKDVEKINNKYPDSGYDARKWRKDGKKKGYDLFIDLLQYELKIPSKKWNLFYMNVLNYKGIDDNFGNILTVDIPFQTVIFDKSSIKNYSFHINQINK